MNEYNAMTTTPTTVLEIGPDNVHPDLFTNSHAVNCAKKRLTYNWRRATADEDIRTVRTKLCFAKCDLICSYMSLIFEPLYVKSWRISKLETTSKHTLQRESTL